jgi:hypothetical protein
MPWTGGMPFDLISEHGDEEFLGTTEVTHAQDQAASPLVWAWVEPYLSRFGFM